MCTWKRYLQKTEEGLWPPEDGVTGGFELHDEGAMNWTAKHSQDMLLTTKPSLYFPKVTFKIEWK